MLFVRAGSLGVEQLGTYKMQPGKTLAPNRVAPLYLPDPGADTELVARLRSLAWPLIEDRAEKGLARRFVASGAPVGLIDARTDATNAIALVRELGSSAEAHGRALLILVTACDSSILDDFIDAGATQFLTAPFDDAAFSAALTCAYRFAERISPSQSCTSDTRQEWEDMLGWRYNAATGVHLGGPLRERLGLEAARFPSLARFYRLLDREERIAARGAIRQLRDGVPRSLFAHDMPGSAGETVTHHLYYDEGTGGLSGRIEPFFPHRHNGPAGDRDPLTGFRDGATAHRWLAENSMAAGQMTLLLISISRFDMVNAAYGRATGDALLRSVARRIEDAVRKVSSSTLFIARLAGADFLIGLRGGEGSADARHIGEGLSQVIARPFVSGEHVIPLSSRIGVVSLSCAIHDATSFLHRAFVQLGVEPDAPTPAIRELDLARETDVDCHRQLEDDLRQALDRDEIVLLFQPQVTITTGAITGVEALARWRHPAFGMLGAETLFATAERSDYLVPLSRHIQQHAVTIAAGWSAELSALRLSVNVTAKDIAGVDFVDHFLAMVDASGFPRSRLTVEITETGLMADLGHAADVLTRLRDAGCRVAIDDFGTGYSSLAYLKALPLDYLKIDKKLAEDIAGSHRDRIVVSGVIEMARSLGLAVIAEGVESGEQLALLAGEGCNYYQGFLCSEPISVETLATLMKDHTGKRAL